MKSKGLYELAKIYQNNGRKPINFDFKNAYSPLEDVNSNNNINHHYIHFYPGRIYPYIPRYILSLPELQTMDGVLLDPFAGSGTILLEALINPYVQRESWGIEINPIGRLISKVKITVFDISLVPEYMKELHKIYHSKTMNTVSIHLFQVNSLHSSKFFSSKFFLIFSNNSSYIFPTVFSTMY